MPINQDKQKSLKKIAFFDLITFGILGIPSFIFIIIALLSSYLTKEVLDRISWLSGVANFFWPTFWLFLIMMNIIYIFYFRQWKRLLYILISGIFSAIALVGFLSISLRGLTSPTYKWTNFESVVGSVSYLLLVCIYPAVHLILAWKNYSRKE